MSSLVVRRPSVHLAGGAADEPLDAVAAYRKLANALAQSLLRFAPDTHRLVQPVYRVTGRGDAERVVTEVGP